jgi:protein O-GlcNAc transferase
MAEITIQQAFDLALQHHQSGRLQEAEQIYRQILTVEPAHPDALHYLGVIAHQTGQCDLAVALVGRAVALRPSYAAAHYTLGIVLNDMGQQEQAIAAYQRAVAAQPDFPDAFYNLGNALSGNGQFDEAIIAYRQAIRLEPDFPEAHNNLGHALTASGQIDDAIAACRKAISLRPAFPEAQNNLGNALRHRKEFDAAITAYRQAIALKPDHAEFHNNLGSALHDRGDLPEAIDTYQRAISLRPGYTDALCNLGAALKADHRLDAAIAAYRQAIAVQPDQAEAHYGLGAVLYAKGEIDNAIAVLRRAIELRPDYAEAHNNLGNALKDQGKIEVAVNAYRQAVNANGENAAIHSNLIYALHYDPGADASIIAAEKARWDQQHARPLQKLIQPHSNNRDPDRRLRIGYVSSDFYEHACAHFLLPLLQGHDPRNVELFCYADVHRPDAITQRMRQHSAHWHNTVGLSDEQVAGQVRRDEIDILIDAKLHTADNRLLIFARKPAPVSVSWLGCPGSSGLSAIDWYFGDPCLNPTDQDEPVDPGQLFRLPYYWCYDPLAGRDIPVSNLPARGSGRITFGSLNNFCKVNEDVLELWAEVLRRVEPSRLLLLAKPGSHRQWTADRFSRLGVNPARIEFADPRPRTDYLKLYHQIDLCLDTFPYNGHTTGLDSLWMGVPVITLAGQSAVSRVGCTHLSGLGLAELIAQTEGQFVNLAAALAQDLPRLEQLRSALRRRMKQSPLMDAAGFARNVESAYRQMWRTWCGTDAST